MKHLKYPRLVWLAQEVQNHLTAKSWFGYGKVDTISSTRPILFAFRERARFVWTHGVRDPR